MNPAPADASSAQTSLLNEGVKNMLLATFFFAVMNVFVKQISHIPAMEIVFFRCLVSAAICFVGIYRAGVDWKGNNHTLLILRGSFGTAALFTFFLTVQNIPLASAVTIQYLSPIFTTLIAVFLLGEKVKAFQWLFYALAFAGVFVMRGFDSNIPAFYLAAGIFSAFCSGMAYNLVRSLKEKEYPLVVVLHFQLIGVFAGLIFTLFNWVTPQSAWDLFCLLMTGVLTQLGQVCLTKSLQAERVANVSILNYTGLIYALAFGVLIFGETYTLQMLLGISLVVLGVLLSIFFSKRRVEVVDETTVA
jgi:drug/metabolite transporter (DMT)-like permease